jgi:hypothetical protein
VLRLDLEGDKEPIKIYMDVMNRAWGEENNSIFFKKYRVKKMYVTAKKLCAYVLMLIVILTAGFILITVSLINLFRG